MWGTIGHILNIILVIGIEFAMCGAISAVLHWMDDTKIGKSSKKSATYQEHLSRSKYNMAATTNTSQSTQYDNEQDTYWKITSFAYQKLKETSVFSRWKYEQFDCQFGKCGICGRPMDRYHTQVDHVKSRYNYGSNYSDNLIVVHKNCNEDKGKSNGIYPSWAKHNRYADDLDRGAWEILNRVRSEYPDKLPDYLFPKPRSIHDGSTSILDESLDDTCDEGIDLDSREIDLEIQNAIDEDNQFSEADFQEQVSACMEEFSEELDNQDEDEDYVEDSVSANDYDDDFDDPDECSANYTDKPDFREMHYWSDKTYRLNDMEEPDDMDDPEYIADQYLKTDYDEWVDEQEERRIQQEIWEGDPDNKQLQHCRRAKRAGCHPPK